MPQAAPPVTACEVVVVDGQKTLQKSGDMGRGTCWYSICLHTLQQSWLINCVVGCMEQGFASGSGRVGLAEAEVGKGGQCDTCAELPMGGHRG